MALDKVKSLGDLIFKDGAFAAAENAKKEQDKLSLYSQEKDFKIEVNSLKISITQPEMVDTKERSIMDVFVFLQALNVEDMRCQERAYIKLFFNEEDTTDRGAKSAEETKKNQTTIRRKHVS